MADTNNSPVSLAIENSSSQNSSILDPLISINPSSQLPLKLTPQNYPSWRGQFNALLLGYNLMGFVDGTHQCPPEIITLDGVEVVNPAHTRWKRQDQLLLHAIMASTSEKVMPFIASATTSANAWDKLTRLYANRSRSRKMDLKERLGNTKREDRSISEYMELMKGIADQLAIIGAPVDDDDLVLHILGGLGPDYKHINGGIRARETPISFEELHDTLVEYERYLKKNQTSSEVSVITANYTKKSHPQNSSNRGGYQRHRTSTNNRVNNQGDQSSFRRSSFPRTALIKFTSSKS
jgi:hypothetical protein